MEIKEVIEHCIQGNRVAQGVLFNTYYRRMYNLSMRILANHQDVEDVLIVSYTKVFSNIHRFEFRGDNSLEKWIKTIVINESIRFVNVRDQIRFDDVSPAIETEPNNDTDISLIDVDQVYSIIEALPAGYRMIFNLFAIEGYSHKEISDMLNITENTSKSQLRKARIAIIERIRKNR